MGKMRAYSAKPSITSGDRCRASLLELDLLFSMGAGGGRWGRKPPASCPRPLNLGGCKLPKATQAIGPNPVPTSAMAMKCALGFCFETLATNGRAVALSPPTYWDELSRGLKTSSFSKSKFWMATLFEWRNLMWDGRCKAVRIVSTIEFVERTQLRCEECTQLCRAERTRLR
jgi:hypothetical protein